MSEAAVRIRRATAADAQAILRLEALFPSDRMSARSVRRFIASPGARVLVAARNGELLGNLVLLTRRGSSTARIYSVIVDPCARGLGIGQQLVAAAETAAQALGCTEVALEVRADNTTARTMYAKRGYVVARELAGYYDDGADGLRLLRCIG